MSYIAHLDPDAPETDRRAEDRAQAKAEGEPMTEADWDRYEAGEGYHSYPGMGSA